MSGKKAHTYTLAPETNKMLFYLSQREGISKSSWLSRQIRREWDRISGSYLDEAIRAAQLQSAEALSDTKGGSNLTTPDIIVRSDLE